MPAQLLLIEDEAMLAELVHAVAEGVGYQVAFADTLQGISDALSAAQPGVIILDLNLPGVETESVLQLLSKSAASSEIIITSGSDVSQIDDVIESGKRMGLNMHSVLSKPFDIRKLEAVLDELRN